ncbi:MAG: hypothetical protein J6Y78_16845, partial [Paludibacteraceae bacterium]|nr:hypothetical protein [Paludibacteraceae bacterium]
MKRLILMVLSFVTLNTSLSARSWTDIDVTRDEYYVTVKGTTDGDGSSWDMALSSEELSYVLPNAKKGATFHLAAGEYNPMLDSTLTVPSNGRDPYRTFLIRKPVTIIGGYPEKPKRNDISDPAKNITLINSDVMHDDVFDKSTGQRENCEEDLRCGVIVDMVESGNCLLKGLRFEGGAPRGGRWDHDGTLEIIGRDNVNTTVQVDSCMFYKCAAAFSLFGANLNVSNSIFQDCGGAFERFIGDVTVNSCSFNNVGMHVYMYSDNTYPITSSLKLINNTILDALFINMESTETSSRATCEMINNTVLNVASTFIRLDYMDLKMIGNIFMSKNFVLETSMGPVSSRYNILNIESEDEYVSQYFSRYDIFTDEDNYLEKLNDGNFNLQNNGGYTPTVKMIRDAIKLGGKETILRFNDLGENVTVDQRGEERGRKKCIGAYEIPCETEYSKTLVTETIQCGEVFNGKQYDLPGVYDTLFITDVNRFGCDSIIPYRLNVMPKTFLKEYYVKEKGKGDGSDWDHAMGVETFDFMLRNVPDGTKFYIAAGEYQPVRDEYGNVPENPTGKRFFTNKIVSLYGGFPATATGTDKTYDPVKYRTVFSGDLGHDNPSTFSVDDMYNDFRKNDVSFLLRISSSTPGDIELKGIVFSHACQTTKEGSCVVQISNNGSGVMTCKMSECTISRGNSGLSTYNCSMDITDCCIKNNYSDAAYISTSQDQSNLTLTRSTFEENGSYALTLGCPFNVNNCTFQSQGAVSLYSSSSGIMANNTIMSDIIVMSEDVKFVGNIMNGSISTIGDGKFTTSYNLISAANEDITVAKTDVKADAELILGVLDQKGAKTSDNGGLTPTIALLSDTLSDGRSIRLPLAETTVTEDQRGVKRLDPTSMGAVEMGCTTVKKSVTDTIEAGKSFLSKVYNKPG